MDRSIIMSQPTSGNPALAKVAVSDNTLEEQVTIKGGRRR
jgi:hypothetical protein